jgi:holin-like protein
MIVSLALILLAQLVGEALARGAGVPVPGPVIGMGLMFAFLLARDAGPLPRLLPKPLTDGTLEGTARVLLANLSLLFVPAGVGVVALGRLVEGQALAIGLVLVVSALVTLGATMLAFVGVRKLLERGGEP